MQAGVRLPRAFSCLCFRIPIDRTRSDKTCKSYSEAIDMLYSCNVFEFQDLETIFQLPRRILPHRLNLIASIQVDLSYMEALQFNQSCDHFPKEWESCWRIIAELQGLRELRVDINMFFELYKPHIPLKTILDPLRAVKGAKIFEVSIHGTMEAITEFWDAPFDAVVMAGREY